MMDRFAINYTPHSWASVATMVTNPVRDITYYVLYVVW